MATTQPIMFWTTAIVVTVAALIDIRTHRIPNWLVLPFLLAGFVVNAVTHGASGVAQSLFGTLMGAVVTGLFRYLGAMGMGDVKLCAAVGAWLGPAQAGNALLLMAVSGGVIALLHCLAGGFLRQTLTGVGSLVSGFARKGLVPHETFVLSNAAARRIAYAPAIAIGTILSFVAKQ